MKIYNPNYADPVLARADQLAVMITDYFATHTGVASITADQIRAAFPAVADELTDGMISQVCQNKGWTVAP